MDGVVFVKAADLNGMHGIDPGVASRVLAGILRRGGRGRGARFVFLQEEEQQHHPDQDGAVGQVETGQNLKSRKSVTKPKRSRSSRFPKAPPSCRPRAIRTGQRAVASCRV
jgi:hypothetical protein